MQYRSMVCFSLDQKMQQGEIAVNFLTETGSWFNRVPHPARKLVNRLADDVNRIKGLETTRGAKK